MTSPGPAAPDIQPAHQLDQLTPRFAGPDLYQLAGYDFHVTFQPRFVGGLAHLVYRDRHRTLQFRGDEIRQLEVADLGLVVSVTLVLSVDSGSTTFTLLLPHVNLPDREGVSCPIACVAVTAAHRVSLAPIFELGQRETYWVVDLAGTASHVISSC